MIYNYLKVALRNLIKFKTYSFINILGLMIGFTCFLLISFYVYNEFTYDQYHEKKDRIFRLGLGGIKENVVRSGISAAAMAHTLKNEYAGIESVVRLRHMPSLVKYEDKSIYEEKFFYIDSTVFDVFTFPMIVGDPSTALVNTFSLVLTRKSAERYFGTVSEDILGKLITVDESMTFTVTGIIKDPPDNSHFHFDMLASASSLYHHPQESTRPFRLENWYAHYYYNYVLLEEGVDAKLVDQNIRSAAKKHSDPDLYERFGSNMGLFLQPIADIHLNPLRGELEPQGDPTILYILGAVALVIIFLASVNYANITTAQSIHRTIEVGIRKTMGAGRRQMTMQFLGESVITSMLALFLAVGVTDLVLPSFNEFAGKSLQMNWIHWSTIVFLLCVSLLTGLLGGLYPAFVLGSYAPVKSLKKTSMSLPGKFSLRKLVVVLQFTISIVLVCGTFVIFSQVKYMLNKDLGLNAEHVIVLPTHGDPLVHEKVDSFFERLSNKLSVLNYSISELSPGDPVYGIVASFEGKEIINYPTTGIDYGWLDTYKMKLKAGRNFLRDQPLDTLERVIINETLCKTLGWTADEPLANAMILVVMVKTWEK